MQKINALLTKLNQPNARIGIEVIIDPEDLGQIKELVEQTQSRFNEVVRTNLEYQHLQGLLKLHLDAKSQTAEHIMAVQISLGMGGVVIEDSSVTQPTATVGSEGELKILVSKETYELFGLWNNIRSFSGYLDGSKPIYSNGGSAKGLADDLQMLLTFLEKNKKA